MKRVEKWRIYVITDRRLSKGRTNEEVVCHAIAGGADVIQFREKEAPAADMYEEALRLRNVTRTMDTPFLINDRIDIALAVDADGVHLGQDDLPVSVARKILGPEKIIGISTHSLEQVRNAFLERPDYISIGPIFPTETKETDSPVGISIIRRIKDSVSIPIIAIGGITFENVREVFQGGADCVALISSIVGAEDVEGTVQSFKARIDAHSRDERSG